MPAARVPSAVEGDLDDLEECWSVQGDVDRAVAIVAAHLRSGGSHSDLIAVLGRALLQDDAGFHWYQVVEAGVGQARNWPQDGEPPVLILTDVARFLAPHTPTRRQLPTVVTLARRLRRGEHLYEELAAPSPSDSDSEPSRRPRHPRPAAMSFVSLPSLSAREDRKD